MKKIQKNNWSEYVKILITAAITYTGTTVVQRNFITKFEENNLIRELIPTLTSDDPREIDMSLTILKETIPIDKYLSIEKIINKKIELIAENSVSNSKKKITNKLNSSDVNRNIDSFNSTRSEWKTLIQNKQFQTVTPLDKSSFLEVLEYADNQTSDATLHKIALEVAKKINNNFYYSAYIGLDWILRNLKDTKYLTLIGITKGDIDSTQKNNIERYYREDKFCDLSRMIFAISISNIRDQKNEVYPKSEGQKSDMLNKTFLDEIKKDNAFNFLFNKKHQNKFENIK